MAPALPLKRSGDFGTVADFWATLGQTRGLPVVVNWYCHTLSTIAESKN